MRGTCTLFAVALAEMMTVGVASTGGVTEESTVDLGEEEHEGFLSGEELDEMYDELDTDKDGKLVDDFMFQEGLNSLHVLNAPSPAATACLAIGEHITSKVLR